MFNKRFVSSRSPFLDHTSQTLKAKRDYLKKKYSGRHGSDIDVDATKNTFNIKFFLD